MPTQLSHGHLSLCQISLQQLYGELAPKYVKYYAFVTFFCCPVLVRPILFSRNCAQVAPLDGF